MKTTPTLSAVTNLENLNASGSTVGAVDQQQVNYITNPTASSFIVRDSVTASAEL